MAFVLLRSSAALFIVSEIADQANESMLQGVSATLIPSLLINGLLCAFDEVTSYLLNSEASCRVKLKSLYRTGLDHCRYGIGSIAVQGASHCSKHHKVLFFLLGLLKWDVTQGSERWEFL